MTSVAMFLLWVSLVLWAKLCMTSGDLGICILPPDGGLCYNLRERWYFDYEKKTCLPFSWTGCGGNENNFESWPECQKACSRYG
ncbi:kunitz-type serine protease inhibitor NACI-like [Pseudonaja textilis]|uniref:kunitz-type serine protease inhibitor NACI-like n=1 Tax=Pseudonaja textilis TaxID=8673 RepID=UPI000EA97FEE|nr:kunitz-type serine protease inhibitor NACI-like [Pseudonaja textilis]